MSRITDRTNMDLISRAVVADLKAVVAKNIVDKMVEDFKEQATTLVRDEMEKVTIEGIQQTMDMLRMRQMLEVRINFGGDDVVSHTI